jgi:hypothetical protein
LARPPPKSAAWAVCLGAAPCGAGGGGERWGSRDCTRRGVARRAHVAPKKRSSPSGAPHVAPMHTAHAALSGGGLANPGRSSDRPRGGGADQAPPTCRLNLPRYTTIPRDPHPDDPTPTASTHPTIQRSPPIRTPPPHEARRSDPMGTVRGVAHRRMGGVVNGRGRRQRSEASPLDARGVSPTVGGVAPRRPDRPDERGASRGDAPTRVNARRARDRWVARRRWRG